MTAEEHGHRFAETWHIEQSENPDLPAEIASLYCEVAERHAAATATVDEHGILEFRLPLAGQQLELAAA